MKISACLRSTGTAWKLIWYTMNQMTSHQKKRAPRNPHKWCLCRYADGLGEKGANLWAWVVGSEKMYSVQVAASPFNKLMWSLLNCRHNHFTNGYADKLQKRQSICFTMYGAVLWRDECFALNLAVYLNNGTHFWKRNPLRAIK